MGLSVYGLPIVSVDLELHIKLCCFQGNCWIFLFNTAECVEWARRAADASHVYHIHNLAAEKHRDGPTWRLHSSAAPA